MQNLDFSFASLSNLQLVEELYQKYLSDPNSVDSSWRYFFEGMQFSSLLGGKAGPGGKASDDLRIYNLIQAYRTYGHLFAQFNPIATHTPEEPPELNLERLGFKQAELSQSFPTCGFLPGATASLKEIVEALQKTYCRTIGIEYMGLGEPALESWLQKRIEPNFELRLGAKEKLRILRSLNAAELFETFIHTKYVGQKRFSLEGGETLIPMLHALLDRGAEEGLHEVVLGMAHRGRLNVLANILNKSYANIFHEFEDHYSPELFEGTGDVKYHKGFIGSLQTHGGQSITVTLSANPSHLESVDPVVEGQARAKQELTRQKESKKEIVPILIHGDAALAGQGVVYETLQMMRLNGYGTGGTLHIVINNQIGFTTLPKDGRSTHYCTDIARAFGSPVFHVDAEDPEGCVAVAKIAIEIRQRFGCDVFIDLNCYRKYGHNETDEPSFTQPLEYKLIKEKKTIREIYCNQLIQEGVLDKAAVDQIEEEFKKNLHGALATIQEEKPQTVATPLQKGDLFESVPTAIEASKLLSLGERMCAVPEGFRLHPKIERLLKDRLAMVQSEPQKPTIDWGMGELLAYATLVDEGITVRLSGQDSRRGTFSHRHAIWIDQVDQHKHFPLSHLKPGQGFCDIFNSPLSEFAVLGFDFGYSAIHPKALVLWEAQFGDFCNGAQVIIDQYLAASEQKWGLASNLTLLLPHGYEGQGPEHSSARMERFLQLCAEENMQVVNCTTPAQLFHLIRRQALRSLKKPLIVFTPKAILRHPRCISPLSAFTSGNFEEVLDDPQPPAKARKILLCSGKMFYELLEEREKRKATDVAIIRIEQLYPFNEKKLDNLLKRYAGFETCVWVQEEHSNMGAWEYIHPLLQKVLGTKQEVRYAGRGRSAATAAGSYTLHKKQLAALLDEAFKN